VYEALHYPEPLPAAELPLRENEVLLEYALGEAAGYVMVVRRGGIQKLVRIPLGREDLEAQVKAFMRPFLDVAPKAFSPQQAKKLHDLLLDGVLPEVKENERVIIIPDGILGLLPFEALILEQGKGVDDSLFVGDRYTLSYYQSATVMALKRRLRAEKASRPLFALGNPVFDPEDERCQPQEKKAPPAAQSTEEPERGVFRALAARKEWGKTTRGGDQGQELEYPPSRKRKTRCAPSPGFWGSRPSPPMCS
jgi:hypothetical protein